MMDTERRTALLGAVLDVQHQLANGLDPNPEIVADLVRAVPALLDEVVAASRPAPTAADQEIERLTGIVREAWRFWADMTSGEPPAPDRGYSVIRVHPERYAAFDALFRPAPAPAPSTPGVLTSAPCEPHGARLCAPCAGFEGGSPWGTTEAADA